MSGLHINNIGSGYNYRNVAGPNTGGGCYAQLGTYNQGFQGVRPPVPYTSVSGYYVVPAYSAPGYDTLTHGSQEGGSGGNYFTIGRAYGTGGSGCSQKYMGSICQ
jgi:hypothetical protein